MKKIKKIPKSLAFIITLFLLSNIVQGQYVTIEGRQFKDENDSNFYPVCMNYIFNIGHSQGLSDYYIMPHVHYGPDRGFVCNNSTNCLDSIEYDFDRIVNMGFNTIHLVGLSPTTDTTGMFIGTHTYNANWWAITYTKKYITYPVINDTMIQYLFGFIDTLCIKANDAGLKVIIDCQTNDVFTFPNALDRVTEYISALSNHINNSSSTIKETLIGYVLVGEPAWNDAVSRTKQDVCDITHDWYDTLKTNDPDHLVASGGMHYFELFKWDPAVIKMDFYFPHVYPYFYSYEDTANVHSQYAAMQRINGILYWLGKNSPVPWMIGETSLSADSVYVPGSGMHGNVTDQANYFDSTLKNVRNCFGSGYSVWQYQEVWWDNPANGQEDNYGLLYHGDQYSLSLSDTSLEKPAVTKFRYFNPDRPLYPCVKPSGYYDPQNFEHFSSGYPKTLTGTITETGSGNPIEDAYIGAWTYYMKSPPDTTKYPAFNYTFSQPDGSYLLNPCYPNSYFLSSDYYFIGITAAGASQEWYDKTVLNSPWQYSFDLNYNPFKYDNVVNNQTVSASRNFQGWNSLTVSDITLQNGTVSEFKARDSVVINGDFIVNAGAETYIYCTETFPECDSYQGMKIMNTGNTGTNETPGRNIEADKQMEVNFIPKSEYAFLDVYPNPANGIFNLYLRTNKQDIGLMQVYVYDITGSCVYNETINNKQSTMNLSSLSKGIYYLHASNNEDSFNQKLVIK